MSNSDRNVPRRLQRSQGASTERMVANTELCPAPALRRSDSRAHPFGYYPFVPDNIELEDEDGPEQFYRDTQHDFDINDTIENRCDTICGISTGSGKTERRGNHIVITSISLRGVVKLSPEIETTAFDARGITHIWVVLNRATQGLSVAPSELFEDTGSGAACRTPLNMNYLSKFRVLAHFVTKLESQVNYLTLPPLVVPPIAAGTSTGFTWTPVTTWQDAIEQIEWNIDCFIPIDYSNTGGSISSIVNNNISILCGHDGYMDDGDITFEGTTRVRFIQGHG